MLWFLPEAGHSGSVPINRKPPGCHPERSEGSAFLHFCISAFLHFCISAFLHFGFPRFEEQGLDF
jgi:hypothetical protein